jgi:hypothetical protein
VTIRATITDGEALREITPEMLKRYLNAHGWQPPGILHPYWWRPAGSYALLSPREGCRDYALRVGEVIRALAQVEGRSELDIYCELVGKPTYEELEREVTALRQGRAPCDSRCPCD